MVRLIPSDEPLITTLLWTVLLSVPFAALLAIRDWQPLSWSGVGWVLASTLFNLGYQGCAIAAYKRAHASQIALAEYSGLVFVTLAGIIGFHEIPDWWTLAGIALIIGPMLIRKKNTGTAKEIPPAPAFIKE
ncbi:DMT family transporter [Dongshaea marina]|uniref:DMT family transporter n=1 Tax=Dongshaea marina TaxID=2047966 RepID=UPI001F2B5A04|nr:DMT family transporter [Dongshaea marina]